MDGNHFLNPDMSEWSGPMPCSWNALPRPIARNVLCEIHGHDWEQTKASYLTSGSFMGSICKRCGQRVGVIPG